MGQLPEGGYSPRRTRRARRKARRKSTRGFAQTTRIRLRSERQARAEGGVGAARRKSPPRQWKAGWGTRARLRKMRHRFLELSSRAKRGICFLFDHDRL